MKKYIIVIQEYARDDLMYSKYQLGGRSFCIRYRVSRFVQKNIRVLISAVEDQLALEALLYPLHCSVRPPGGRSGDCCYFT